MKPMQCRDCSTPITQRSRYRPRLFCADCVIKRKAACMRAYYVEHFKDNPEYAAKNKRRAKAWRERNKLRVEARNAARRRRPAFVEQLAV